MTSATTGHATCRRGNSVWPSTTLTIARAMRSRARIPRRRRASRSRSGGSALARGPVVGGPLKGLFNARMSPRGVTGVSNYGLSRFHDILDVLHHDDHFASIARAILFKGAGLAEIATPLLILVMSASDLERLTINTIRTLAMDAVQAAKSGHPGTPMAMAPVVYCLWQEFLRFDPDDPIWPNRDRFVLSMGHASMLLYSMLTLAGVKAVNATYERLGQPALRPDDIKRLRQLDSKAPRHAEYRSTSRVEGTTGPLGQGVATSVGMAIAGRWMARHFNRPGFDLFGYDVYALCGDGCMMEGISGEAASLAGHLQLANLCWIYDNNKITIEGHTDWAFSEDVATRFIAYRWNVTRVGDANDIDMLRRAFRTFHATTDRPTLIIVDSHIAYGAPNKQDPSAARGEPPGEEGIRLPKPAYGWPEDAKFLVPDGVREHVASGVGKRGRALRDAWFALVEENRRAYPELADQVYRMQHRQLPEGWDRDLPSFPADAKGLAGRDASAQVLNALARNVPWLIGGAAGPAPPTKTRLAPPHAGEPTPPTPRGRELPFGLRGAPVGAVLDRISPAQGPAV